MRRAAIVAPLRTAVGAFGGSLKALGAEQLASTVLKALIERSGIDPARIDEVVIRAVVREQRGAVHGPLGRARRGVAGRRAGL